MTIQQAATAGFVLEIDGRAVLVLSASSIRKAQKLCSQPWFFDEVERYRSGGAPIWDGRSALTLRAARPDEKAMLDDACLTELARGEFGDVVFAFLVALDPDLH